MDFSTTSLYGLKTIYQLENLFGCSLSKYTKQKQFINEFHCYVLNNTRLIDKPSKELLSLQQKLNTFLQEIELPEYYFSKKGENNISNAAIHKNSKYLLKIDIYKFFPSISRDKVFKFFRNELNMSSYLANILTNITTVDTSKIKKLNKEYIALLSEIKGAYHNHLATGAASSTLLSFLVNYDMYQIIFKEVLINSCKLSVYVDDITISSQQNISHFFFLKIRSIIHDFGYYINSSKTKMHNMTTSEAEVTGIIISKGKLKNPNRIEREIYNLKRNNNASNDSKSSKLQGLKNYKLSIKKYN